jgi:hypothetical protein
MTGKPKDKAEAGKLKPEKVKRKSNAGAKSKYDDTLPEIAEGYARRGLSDADIAKNLGISLDAYYRYQKQFPEFYEAIRRGKRPANIIVENALFKRCIGFEFDEPSTETYVDEKGKKHVKKKTTTKYIIPDINAIRFWLINREPDLWKTIREEIESENYDKAKVQLTEYLSALLNKEPKVVDR